MSTDASAAAAAGTTTNPLHIQKTKSFAKQLKHARKEKRAAELVAAAATGNPEAVAAAEQAELARTQRKEQRNEARTREWEREQQIQTIAKRGLDFDNLALKYPLPNKKTHRRELPKILDSTPFAPQHMIDPTKFSKPKAHQVFSDPLRTTSGVVARRVFECKMRDVRMIYKSEYDAAKKIRDQMIADEWRENKRKRAIRLMERRNKQDMTIATERARFKQFLISREEERHRRRTRRLERNARRQRENIYKVNYMLAEAKSHWVLDPDNDLHDATFVAQVPFDDTRFPGLWPEADAPDLVANAREAKQSHWRHMRHDYDSARRILNVKQQIIANAQEKTRPQILDEERLKLAEIQQQLANKELTADEAADEEDYVKGETQTHLSLLQAPPTIYDMHNKVVREPNQSEYYVSSRADIVAHNLTCSGQQAQTKHRMSQNEQWKIDFTNRKNQHAIPMQFDAEGNVLVQNAQEKNVIKEAQLMQQELKAKSSLRQHKLDAVEMILSKPIHLSDDELKDRSDTAFSGTTSIFDLANADEDEETQAMKQEAAALRANVASLARGEAQNLSKREGQRKNQTPAQQNLASASVVKSGAGDESKRDFLAEEEEDDQFRTSSADDFLIDDDASDVTAEPPMFDYNQEYAKGRNSPSSSAAPNRQVQAKDLIDQDQPQDDFKDWTDSEDESQASQQAFFDSDDERNRK